MLGSVVWHNTPLALYNAIYDEGVAGDVFYNALREGVVRPRALHG